MNLEEILLIPGALVLFIAFILIVRARHRSYRRNVQAVAQEEVCDHLRPAYEALIGRGHLVRRVGQKHPDLPLEIHLHPPFEPQVLYDELKLADPVFVSERNVLYCKEDWCEIHPTAR